MLKDQMRGYIPSSDLLLLGSLSLGQDIGKRRHAFFVFSVAVVSRNVFNCILDNFAHNAEHFVKKVVLRCLCVCGRSCGQ